MNEQLEACTQKRIQWLYRYTNAMEQGDSTALVAIMREAEQDSVLERMILEVNEVYQIEDCTVVHNDDILLAQEMLHTILAESTQQKPEEEESMSINARVLHSEDKPPVPQTLVARHLAARKWYRMRRNWAATAAAVALIAVLVIPNASVLASQFLALFQVKQFHAVTVNPSQLRRDLLNYLENFSDSQISAYAGNQTGRDPSLSATRSDMTQAQVEQFTNLHLQLPAYLPAGVGHVAQFSVSPGEQGTFIFNNAKALAYLKQTGQGNIAIPAQLKNATFTVKLAPGVQTNYYTSCQIQAVGINRCSGGTMFTVVEIPSPVINGPQLKDLRDFMLSLPKLSTDLRTVILNVDVNSGVVPVPISSSMSAQQVTIQGATGLQLSDNNLDVVLWQKQGIVYMIGTTGGHSSQILDAARSLR